MLLCSLVGHSRDGGGYAGDLRPGERIRGQLRMRTLYHLMAVLIVLVVLSLLVVFVVFVGRKGRGSLNPGGTPNLERNDDIRRRHYSMQ